MNHAGSIASCTTVRVRAIRKLALFLSLEDDLMRRYGNSEKMTGMLQKVGMEEDEISIRFSTAPSSAQKRVEQHHYQIRRKTLNMTT